MITSDTDNYSFYTYQLADQGYPKEADGRICQRQNYGVRSSFVPWKSGPSQVWRGHLCQTCLSLLSQGSCKACRAIREFTPKDCSMTRWPVVTMGRRFFSDALTNIKSLSTIRPTSPCLIRVRRGGIFREQREA